VPCKAAANIVIDGMRNDNTALVTALVLSHGPGAGTARALKADSSVGIVFP